MTRQASMIILIIVALLPVLAGCLNLRLPTTEEVEQVFVRHTEEHELEGHVPHDVPIINSAELGGWRELCDHCHVGPAYSSHTILNWGHLEVCLENTSCLSCHGEELHRMDVRGHKRLCYECHIDRSIPVKCAFCHDEEHAAAYPPHEPAFRGDHGDNILIAGFDCYQCHGSEFWCKDCHGLLMPHPEDIINSHPELVLGQPGVCSNCHGTRSCDRCHEERGIAVDSEIQ